MPHLLLIFTMCMHELSLLMITLPLSLWVSVNVILKHPQQCSIPMWFYKIISHIQVFFFSNPTHQTKIGTANMWKTTNSKPHGPVIMIGQSKTRSNNHIVFIFLFFRRCYALLCILPTLANCAKCWAKTIMMNQISMFWFFFIQF
jgi:hypothetical protein